MYPRRLFSLAVAMGSAAWTGAAGGTRALAQESRPAAAVVPTSEDVDAPLRKVPLVSADGKPLTSGQRDQLAQCDKLMTDALDLRRGGRFAEAAEAAGRAANLRKSVLGNRHHLSVSADVLARTMAVFAAARDDRRKKLAQAETTAETARRLLDKADYKPALEAAEEVRKLVDAALPPDHVEAGHTLSLLGDAQGSAGDADECYESLKAALGIIRTAYGEHHPETAAVLERLGRVQLLRGDADGAYNSMKRSVETFREQIGDDARTARSLDGLARVLLAQGRVDAAETCERRTLRICEELFGADSLEVVPSCIALAGIARDLDRYDESVALRRRVISICEKRLPADHPNVAAQKYELANTFLRRRLYQDAIDLLEPIVKADRARPGRPTGDALGRALLLGSIYVRMGRLDEGVDLISRVGILSTNMFPPGDMRLYSTAMEFTFACEAVGDLERASQSVESALKFAELNVGVQSYQTVMAQHAAGRIHTRRKNYDLAAFAFERAREILKTNPVSDVVGMASIETDWAVCKLARGDRDAAVADFRSILSRLRKYAAEHPSVQIDAMIARTAMELLEALKPSPSPDPEEQKALAAEALALLRRLRDARALDAKTKQWLDELEPKAP